MMRFNNQAYFILYNIKFKLFSDYSLTIMLKTGLVIEAKNIMAFTSSKETYSQTSKISYHYIKIQNKHLKGKF